MPQGLQDYGSGFLRGLTNVASQARADAREQEDQEQQQRTQMVQLALTSGDPELIRTSLAAMTEGFGGAAKGGTRRKSMIAQLLLGGIGQRGGEAQVGGGGQLRVSTPEQTLERDVARTTAITDAETTARTEAEFGAKRAVAQRMFEQGTFPSLEASLAAVGIAPPQVSATSIQGVAGEVPNATGGFDAAFGILDRRPTSPTFGQYIDPEDGEPLEGFRPRTTTGSRSLGTEREALALELFGVPASQLNSEQMGILNRMLPARAGELAEARGLGTGAARIETELGMPLTEAEVARQDVPFGTTMRDLIGFEPVTPDQRSRKEAVTTLAPQIANIRTLIGRVFPAASGLTGAITASAVLAQKRSSRDPDMASLTAAINLAIANVARVLAAESGRITERDAERAQSALADIEGFTDTRESALAKISQAEEAMAIIARSIQTPGEQLREGVTIQFQDQTLNFDSQEQADLFLRAAGAPPP